MHKTLRTIPSFRRFGEWLFAALCMVLFLFAAGNDAHASQPLKVVVFGDSLTSGYQLEREQAFPYVLERKLKERGYDAVVVNASVSGDTTADGVRRLDTIIAMKPDLVFVELGGNDVIRGLDTTQIYNNIHIILATLKANNIPTIFAGTVPPANLGASYIAQYKEAQDRVVNFNGSSYYPNFLENIAGIPEMNLADGYHPNVQGTEMLVETIYPSVDAVLRWKLEYLQMNPPQK